MGVDKMKTFWVPPPLHPLPPRGGESNYLKTKEVFAIMLHDTVKPIIALSLKCVLVPAIKGEGEAWVSPIKGQGEAWVSPIGGEGEMRVSPAEGPHPLPLPLGGEGNESLTPS